MAQIIQATEANIPLFAQVRYEVDVIPFNGRGDREEYDFSGKKEADEYAASREVDPKIWRIIVRRCFA